ncbi:MAG: 16S rRNA (guanine(966)-N(2))-methyltransferase RsmD [Calditrichae bacterium]|nr:16S rRNA (guanine(966)-N(2))-methyltransferase RsmD [Calditrichota bacterium]MCB9057645.1 16S rRNA (guanine(966)-N(2))-methyltransferase RsmD [Calditrichia bacterium]
MRIISGIYKGRRLQAGNDLSIRPTTDRVKEYIFNILQDFPENKVVADIFSGSGNLGLESLSRGAAKVVFVEKNISSVKVLKKNLETFRITSSNYSIINTPAQNFAAGNHEDIQLYLLDPPFVYPELQLLIDTFTRSEHFMIGNLLVLEHEVSNNIKLEGDLPYNVLKQKKMGRSLISFLEKRS